MSDIGADIAGAEWLQTGSEKAKSNTAMFKKLLDAWKTDNSSETMALKQKEVAPKDDTVKNLAVGAGWGALSPKASSALIYGGAGIIQAAQKKWADREAAIAKDIVERRKNVSDALAKGQARQDRALAAIESMYARGLNV